LEAAKLYVWWPRLDIAGRRQIGMAEAEVARHRNSPILLLTSFLHEVGFGMKPKPVPAGYLMIAKDDLAGRINRLPIWARRYIHDLEIRADPSGDIQELADLRIGVLASIARLRL
jgi:hypothetical protein